MTKSLVDQVALAKRSVNTDSLSFSLNEFVGMYEAGEINIHPAFQRTFRWGVKQQSNLIESLLIGVPLPSIFVFENPNGIWELVDGLQRSSTIFKFLGVLKDAVTGGMQPPSALVGTKYLDGLEGLVWKKSADVENLDIDSQNEMDPTLQLFLKRCRINVEVLKQPSDPATKFDLFQRLNRGGSVANDQEVRTCTVVMKSPDHAEKIVELAASSAFLAICQLSDDDIKKQKDVEYATRLICHTYYDLTGREDLNEFLDRAILQALDDFSVHAIAGDAAAAAQLVMDACGENALISPSASRRVLTMQGLEVVLVGVARNYASIAERPDPVAYVKKRVDEFWTSSDSSTITSSGMRATDRLSRTIPLGASWFSKG